VPVGFQASPRRPRTVTFVEIVLVMVIVAIVATLATPRIHNALCRQRVEAAARRIIMDLTLARQQAQASGVGQVVTFDIDAESYRLVGRSNLDSAASEYQVLLSEEPYRVDLASAKFGGDSQLAFDMYGRPDSGGSAVVQIGAHSRTVTVHPDTGKADAS
jgi:type II secretory pathway pseudopilin PulG